MYDIVTSQIGMQFWDKFHDKMAGHSAECYIEWFDPSSAVVTEFYDSEEGVQSHPVLQKRNCSSYLMFGSPPQFEFARMVMKGSEDFISSSIEPTGEFVRLQLYDQMSRSIIRSGKLTCLWLSVHTLGKLVIVSPQGIEERSL